LYEVKLLGLKNSNTFPGTQIEGRGNMSTVIWVVLAISIIVVFCTWYSRKSEKDLREIKEKIWSEEILAHQNEWGNETCQWLLENKIDPFSPEALEIINNFQKRRQDYYQKLLSEILMSETELSSK